MKKSCNFLLAIPMICSLFVVGTGECYTLRIFREENNTKAEILSGSDRIGNVININEKISFSNNTLSLDETNVSEVYAEFLQAEFSRNNFIEPQGVTELNIDAPGVKVCFGDQGLVRQGEKITEQLSLTI